MKKNFCLIIGLLLAAALVGCGGSGSAGRTGNQSAGVNDVLESQMASADEQKTTEDGRQSGVNSDAPEPEIIDPAQAALSSTEGINVDLTKLSSTMEYSEVYDMMVEPSKYIGKIVKMNGAFSVYHDEANDIYYFACIVQDATACCAHGIEFVLDGDYKYPDDYPELGDEIYVVGVFDTYKEGQATYCTLRNAQMTDS